MPTGENFSRGDALALKSLIENKIGSLKAEIYFHLLARFLSCKITKTEFDRLCISAIGRQNVRLHNSFLRAIIRNVCLSKSHPAGKGKVREASLSAMKLPHGFQRSTVGFQSLCKDLKGRSRLRRSVEDGEEVDQSMGRAGTRCSIESPLGISLRPKTGQKFLSSKMRSGYYTETCYGCGELPDTSSLKKRLEQNLGVDGLGASLEFTNLLNLGLDVFLKRLIKPCLEMAGSRPRQCSSVSASLVDFQVATELNPLILGEGWPTKLDRIRLCPLEQIFLNH